MDSNEENRIQKTDVLMRVLTVNDAELLDLERIYFRHVEKLCVPVLNNAGYSAGKVDFRRLNVLANCPFASELRFYESLNGILSSFVFKTSRGDDNFLAVYAPYSSKIYLLKDDRNKVIDRSEFVDCGVPDTVVRLNMKYFFQEDESKLYRYVYQYSRKAVVEKTLFLRRLYLRLVGDFLLRRTVSRKYEEETQAFAKGFLFSEYYRNYELFYLTGNQ